MEMEVMTMDLRWNIQSSSWVFCSFFSAVFGGLIVHRFKKSKGRPSHVGNSSKIKSVILIVQLENCVKSYSSASRKKITNRKPQLWTSLAEEVPNQKMNLAQTKD